MECLVEVFRCTNEWASLGVQNTAMCFPIYKLSNLIDTLTALCIDLNLSNMQHTVKEFLSGSTLGKPGGFHQHLQCICTDHKASYIVYKYIQP